MGEIEYLCNTTIEKRKLVFHSPPKSKVEGSNSLLVHISPPKKKKMQLLCL